MKTHYDWYDLLVLTGFMPHKDYMGGTTLFLHNSDDTDFLDSLLERTKAEFKKDRGFYAFSSTPPTASVWFKGVSELVGGMESGSNVHARDIEFPLNAVVMQLKRLNIETVESCKGFHNRHQQAGPTRYRGAYVKFLTWRGAFIAETMLKSGGYCCELDPYKRLFINEGTDGILDLGLWLNGIPDAYHYRKPLLEKRERRLIGFLDIPGVSGNEQEVGEHLMTILKNRLDTLWMDEAGNVLGTLTIPGGRGDAPTLLLSAHMDVKDSSGEGKEMLRVENILRREGGILGADDRAGIAAIINTLDMLNQYRIACNLKVAFTVLEEVGMRGAEQIDESFFEGVTFAVSLDRRGETDIVVRTNDIEYCQETEAGFISYLSKQLWHNEGFHYKAVEGGRSDLIVWSQLGIPSVNLSVGYSDEHKESESLNLDAWHRVQDLLLEIITYKMEVATRRR
jgi:hypothetical protein